MMRIILLGLLIGLVYCQNIEVNSNNSPVIEGYNFIFGCNASHFLSYRVNSLDSGPLFDRVDASPAGNYRTFVFPNVQRSDNGTVFTCFIGPFSDSVTLIVHFRAEYTSPSVTEALFCSATRLNVSFDIMSGFPMSTFSLTKNNNNINLPNASATGIYISSLSVTDAGEYVFSVTNEAGTTNVSLSLTVYCGQFLQAGNNASRTVIVPEGGNFSIDCTVTSSTPTATIELVIGSNAPMDITSNPIRSFTNAAISSAGTYTCRASSGQATTTYTYTIMVNQANQNTVTPTMTTPTPSVTPSESPTDGAGVMKLSVIAGLILLFAMFVVN